MSTSIPVSTASTENSNTPQRATQDAASSATHETSAKSVAGKVAAAFWRSSPGKSLSGKNLSFSETAAAGNNVSTSSTPISSPRSSLLDQQQQQQASGTLAFTGAGSTEEIVKAGFLIVGISNATGKSTSITTRTSLGQFLRPSFSKKFLVVTKQFLHVKAKANSPGFLGSYALPALNVVHEEGSESFIAVFPQDEASSSSSSSQRVNVACKTASAEEAALWIGLLTHAPRLAQEEEEEEEESKLPEVSAIFSEAASMTMVQEATTIVSPTEAERLAATHEEGSTLRSPDEAAAETTAVEEVPGMVPVTTTTSTSLVANNSAKQAPSWLFSFCCTAD